MCSQKAHMALVRYFLQCGTIYRRAEFPVRSLHQGERVVRAILGSDVSDEHHTINLKNRVAIVGAGVSPLER